ncbi:MAG: hypothetical protein M3277_04305 [Actinomycetota bacterium]|nr:hypothetical protein [Actinomycetota bacterium]
MGKLRPGLTLLLACLVIFALAPAAAAQLPSDPVGDIGDTVGGGGGIGDPIGGGSGGGLGDPVGDITDPLDGNEGSSGPGGKQDDPKLEEGILKPITDTVNKPEDKVDETVNDPSGSVGQTIDRSLGGIGNRVTKDVSDVTKGLHGGDGKGRKKTSNGDANTGAGAFGTGSGRRHDKVFAASLAARMADAKNRTPSSTLTSSTTSTDATGPAGVIQQIGRVAAEAAQRAAFPLVLILLVGAFLIGQNRIDRRDPKLAMAPVDSDQDLLSFT